LEPNPGRQSKQPDSPGRDLFFKGTGPPRSEQMRKRTAPRKRVNLSYAKRAKATKATKGALIPEAAKASELKKGPKAKRKTPSKKTGNIPASSKTIRPPKVKNRRRDMRPSTKSSLLRPMASSLAPNMSKMPKGSSKGQESPMWGLGPPGVSTKWQGRVPQAPKSVKSRSAMRSFRVLKPSAEAKMKASNAANLRRTR